MTVKWLKKSSQPKEYTHIAVELPFGLGDKIMCIPLFFSLKKAWPKARLTVLSPNSASSLLLKHCPAIDEILEYPLPSFSYKALFHFFFRNFLKFRKQFKQRNIDLFIVVHPNPFRSLLLRLLPFQTGIQNLENLHKTLEVKNILDALQVHLCPVYTLTKEPLKLKSQWNLQEKNYLLLDLYAQHLEKDPRQWHQFPELIRLLKEKGLTLVTAGKNPFHKKIDGVIDLVNQTSFSELLALIAHAKAVISMDTGLFHFSYALKTPVFGIFGPVNPQDRIPLDRTLPVQTLYHHFQCSPCIDNKVDIECRNQENLYGCMKEISFQEVFEKVRSWIL